MYNLNPMAWVTVIGKKNPYILFGSFQNENVRSKYRIKYIYLVMEKTLTIIFGFGPESFFSK